MRYDRRGRGHGAALMAALERVVRRADPPHALAVVTAGSILTRLGVGAEPEE